uniref:Uncharacterized protein n=1 Tax=Globodera rostochiensis TaxID=31243 RepID=A0A914I654_GLORO
MWDTQQLQYYRWRHLRSRHQFVHPKKQEFRQWLVNGLVAKGERQCPRLNMPLRVMTCRTFGSVPIEA